MVTQQMKAFLQKRLSADDLHSMAIMGLPAGAPAPWIFLSMLRGAPGGPFGPVPNPTLDGTQFAIMLTPAGQSPRVVPTPHPNNLSPITCLSGAPGPGGGCRFRRGREARRPIFSDLALPTL